MFEFDDCDDILSTFEDGDGEDLLKALSNHNGNFFDDIDVGESSKNFGNSKEKDPVPKLQSCSDSGSASTSDVDLNLFRASSPWVTSVTTVDTFRRRKSLDGMDPRPYRPMRSRSKRNISSRGSSMMSETDGQLFAGRKRRSEGDVFDDDDSSDMASACSAPADLMAMYGLYDDPTVAPNVMESAETPDVLDIHSLFGLNQRNTGQRQQMHPQQQQLHQFHPQQQRQQQQSQPSAAIVTSGQNMSHAKNDHDEETMMIRQRQQQLLLEERQLQAAAASQRSRRSKSVDANRSLDDFRMNMIQNGVTNSIFRGNAMNVTSGGNIQMKRRKSEPSTMDFSMEEMAGELRTPLSNNYLSQSTHSLDHLHGFVSTNTSSHSLNDDWGKTALDVAVEEAQVKIDHLKKLLLLSRNKNGSGGGVPSVPQALPQQPVANNWWASLSSELNGGGTGLRLDQSVFSPNQDLAIPTKSQKKKVKKKPKPKPAPPTPAQIPLPDKADPEILKLDPKELMEKLKNSMSRTASSMKKLQDWDRSNGLPKSHSQTMTNSNKSRKQLADEAGLQLDETEDEEKVDEIGDEIES